MTLRKGASDLSEKDYADYGGMEDGPRKVSINYLTGVKLIDESIWDESTEEIIMKPRQKESVSRKFKSISTINWDSLYDDL